MEQELCRENNSIIEQSKRERERERERGDSKRKSGVFSIFSVKHKLLRFRYKMNSMSDNSLM